MITPESPDWEQMRRGWNLSVDQQPAAVVEAAGPDQVAEAVKYAATQGLQVSAQAGGHGATYALDGMLVVRTSALDSLSVDVTARTARVGAGVRWGDLQAALDGTGLTGLPGSSANVSVVGYCLNGGFSWFSRPYGSGAGSLRAVELVDAAGERRWIDDASEPDLMWALRGGGGNFGVVTAVELDLHRAPAITGGRLIFPIEQAGAVLTAYGQATREAPDNVTLWAYLAQYPTPACMVDVITPDASSAELEQALSLVRAAGTPVSEVIRPLQPSEVADFNSVPAPPQALSLITSPFQEVTPELIGTLQEYGKPPLFQVVIRHLRSGQDGTYPGVAAADPQAPYLVLAVSIARTPDQQEPGVRALRALQEALSPWSVGQKTPTGLSSWNTLDECYGPNDLARLREIKQRVDPGDRFVGNFRLL
ncbi:FAD-binding oxidoreductase [Kribbella sp. GL6]|uniref:FAD-binding oxidoreductase n=1 Tax=Kribbella sp. GL6 TaxID=3419765 RepID=UPI003D00563A